MDIRIGNRYGLAEAEIRCGHNTGPLLLRSKQWGLVLRETALSMVEESIRQIVVELPKVIKEVSFNTEFRGEPKASGSERQFSDDDTARPV